MVDFASVDVVFSLVSLVGVNAVKSSFESEGGVCEQVKSKKNAKDVEPVLKALKDGKNFVYISNSLAGLVSPACAYCKSNYLMRNIEGRSDPAKQGIYWEEQGWNSSQWIRQNGLTCTIVILQVSRQRGPR